LSNNAVYLSYSVNNLLTLFNYSNGIIETKWKFIIIIKWHVYNNQQIAFAFYTQNQIRIKIGLNI